MLCFIQLKNKFKKRINIFLLFFSFFKNLRFFKKQYFLKKINLFIYFQPCWVFFVAARRVSLAAASRGAALCCGAEASHCSAFSCCGAQALGTWALVVAARRLSSCGSWALECRLSSCGARAQLLRGMWALPGLGIEPMSHALAGGFLTTAPPGKSQHILFSL